MEHYHGGPDPSSLTVLRCLDRNAIATKTLGRAPDGDAVVVSSYAAGAWFAVRLVPVSGLASLADAVRAIARDPRAFIIRAEALPGTDMHQARRLLYEHVDADGEVWEPTFRAVPRPWVAVDIDALDLPLGLDMRDYPEECASFARRQMPGELREVATFWQATSSAGVKPGARLRLWFWLDRTVTGAELCRWFNGCPVDRATFRDVQPIFCARPILRGVADPVPCRDGMLDGEPVARVPELPEPEPVMAHQIYPGPIRAADRYARAALAGEVEAVAGWPEGGARGRHWRLSTAGLKLARHVESGALAPQEVVDHLAAAAQRAGLTDPPRELARIIATGLRQGIAGGGTP